MVVVFFALFVPAIVQAASWHLVETWQMNVNTTPNETVAPSVGGSADFMGFFSNIGPYLSPFIALLYSILKFRRTRKKCADALRFVIYRIILILSM